MGELPHDLLTPGVELEETHISWVFLGPREVWKVKKPVDLGFLDFTTVEARRAACEDEVLLNRRLAPGVYHGVVAITVDAGGRHRIGGEGVPVDWAVHMRRLDAASRADHRLREGRLERDHLTLVAQRLASFHAAAACDETIARFGSTEAIGRNVRENFRQTRDVMAAYLSAEEAAEIERWQTGVLERSPELFAERMRAGRVRDGHGDLRLEHLYLSERGDGALELAILDCIEFNERFRYADVCADVAFLSMDLARHGRVDYAELFLARYAREANDYDLYPLVDFYQSYRAYVRGKVAAMLAADQRAGAGARARAAAEAHLHFKLALAAERPSLLEPMVIAVGGPIAAGKSITAEWIGDHRSAPVVDSDRTRKFLLGKAPTDKVWHPPFHGGYAPEVTAGVYDEVTRRAAAVLGSGRAVVIDASFRSRDERAAARRLAAEQGVAFLFVECAADAATLRARLVERSRRTGVSDGRLEILDDFLASWQPVDELQPAEHLRLDTTLPLEATTAALRARLALWPSRLSG